MEEKLEKSKKETRQPNDLELEEMRSDIIEQMLDNLANLNTQDMLKVSSLLTILYKFFSFSQESN